MKYSVQISSAGETLTVTLQNVEANSPEQAAEKSMEYLYPHLLYMKALRLLVYDESDEEYCFLGRVKINFEITRCEPSSEEVLVQ